MEAVEVAHRLKEGGASLGHDQVDGVEAPAARKTAAKVSSTAQCCMEALARWTAKGDATSSQAAGNLELADDGEQRDVVSKGS